MKSSPFHLSHASTVLAAAIATLLAGCATPGAPPVVTVAAAPGPAPAAAASSPTGPRPPAAVGAPPPFADVTKDAKSSEGFLTVWTKDEKTWLEIPADKLDQPFFFGISQATGLGERFFWPGLMGGEQVVVLRRVGNNVQLVARNLRMRAPDGGPLARAVAESYSDSLLAAAPLAAAPHPDRKSLLIDASSLLGVDIAGAQTQLEASYRMPYGLDRANSSIERTRTGAQGTFITMRQHFAVPKLPAPPVLVPGAPPPNPAALPNPPSVVPDARSLFLSYSYTMAPLPAQPMKPRLADQRVGYFTDAYMDLSNDAGGEIKRTHLINRWRLEKQDPTAAVSKPLEPIRVVMDRNIPEKWRAAVREGILKWNLAYERAGFKDAVTVEQQAADADWSALEGTRMLAVRWFAIEGPGATAVGPSQSDPRTGEILRGAAIIPENWIRFFRALGGDTEPRLPAMYAAMDARPASFAKRWAECDYATDALEQAQFGFELLSERGAFTPGSPEAERYIAQSLTDVVMHEVGHALGLRHNFKASTGITPAQLRDPAFTKERGTSNSVMDYNALNIPLDGEAVADYHMTTLGRYDYWAIEYGYKPFPADTEKAELAKLASMSDSDPTLAYATDEDNIGALDPLVNQRDLGDDPLAFAQRQMKLTRELWKRTQARTLAADDDMTVYRRNLQRGLNYMAATVPLLGKYLGGNYTSRALAGAQQPVFTPVPPAQQRAALDLMLTEIFGSASFRFDPKFMSRLAVDQMDRTAPGRFMFNTDFSLPSAVLAIQRGALDGLMSDALAGRLADAEPKVTDTKALLNYADVQTRLSNAVWSELRGGKARDIDSLRRNLQREHLRRLAGGLLRPGSMAAADVRAVNRQVALQLEGELKTALAGSGWSSIARAHLADSLATLSEALKAPLAKQGV